MKINDIIEINTVTDSYPQIGTKGIVLDNWGPYNDVYIVFFLPEIKVNTHPHIKDEYGECSAALTLEKEVEHKEVKIVGKKSKLAIGNRVRILYGKEFLGTDNLFAAYKIINIKDDLVELQELDGTGTFYIDSKKVINENDLSNIQYSRTDLKINTDNKLELEESLFS